MRKLTQAEAGKLGAEKTKVVIQQKIIKKINEYNLNPSLCKNCKISLEYKSKKNTFCSKNCAANFNNSLRDSVKNNRKAIWNCTHCNKEHYTKLSKIGKFCNNQCQHNFRYQERLTDWLVRNNKVGKSVIKRYLGETYGKRCSNCGIEAWCGKEIVLELEHKDGNSENNVVENLCLLCPNCHSQTPTFKGKNKGNGRHIRRTRYNEGKSF